MKFGDICYSLQAQSQTLAWSPLQNLGQGSPTPPKGTAVQSQTSCALPQALPSCHSMTDPVTLPRPPCHLSTPSSLPRAFAPTVAPTGTPFPSVFFTYVLLFLQVSAQMSLPQGHSSFSFQIKIFLLNAVILHVFPFKALITHACSYLFVCFCFFFSINTSVFHLTVHSTKIEAFCSPF